MLFIFVNCFSQAITAKAELDSSQITIGRQARLKLTVEYKINTGKDIKIKWPELKDTIIKQIEIVNKSKIEKSIPDQKDQTTFRETQVLTLTSFDSGYYAIPPFAFADANDSTQKAETEALLLQVNTVPVDTAKAIKDIKPPIEVPFSWKEYLPYLYWGLTILAVLAGIIIAIVKLTKNKKPAPVVEYKPDVPPHELALGKLARIREEKLWQGGRIKEYHTAVTDVLREYIEARFRVYAVEQTTEEILLNFRSADIDDALRSKLKQVLILADLVKFAKELPIAFENENSISNAEDFVRMTIPRPAETSEIKQAV